MKRIHLAGLVCVVAVSCAAALSAQESATAAQPEAPTQAAPGVAESVVRLIKFSGLVRDALGQPRPGIVGITLALYAEQEGGSPLWLETQNVALDGEGRYTVLLGAESSEGLPLEIFASEEARWLGVQVQGEEEQPRILLVSVPYALKAADAETLGGKPLSAFVQVESESTSTSAAGEEAATSAGSGAPAQTISGTTNFVAKFLNSTDLGDSTIFESGGQVGIGTSSPTGFQVNAALGTEEAQGVDNFRLGIFLGTPRMILEDAGSPVWELDNAGGLFRIFNPGVLSFAIDASGNVGVGTASPTGFQVNAALGTEEAQGVDNFRMGIYLGTPRMILEDAGSPVWELDNAGGTFRIFNPGLLRFAIDPSGNVGIGTASPTEKLEVAGNVKVSGQINANDGNFASVTATTGIATNSVGQIGGNPITITTGNLQLTGGLSIPSGVLSVSGNIDTASNVNVGGGLTTNGGGGITINNGALFVSSPSANSVIAGNLNVNGTLSKGGGSFKIDHPLDPATKYLYHSFVESPDMMNIYNGVVKLDARGEAWVSLPAYFEALNSDFRYQLTCMGGFAPVFIAEEIRENRFRIAGGRSGLKVSWQVTGIRRDSYANAHRIQVEEEKGLSEQGFYLHPEAFGLGPDRGIAAAHRRTGETRDTPAAAGSPQ